VLLPKRHIRADEKPNLCRPYCRLWADGRSTSLTLSGHEIGFPPSDENPVIVSSQIVTQHTAENASSGRVYSTEGCQLLTVRQQQQVRLSIGAVPNLLLIWSNGCLRSAEEISLVEVLALFVSLEGPQHEDIDADVPWFRKNACSCST
jgi:hypothetical protein